MKVKGTKIDIDILIDIIRTYHNDKTLELHGYTLEELKVDSGIGKDKIFYRLQLITNKFTKYYVLKLIPEVDGAIISSKDDRHREVIFPNSKYFENFSKFVKIPIVGSVKDGNNIWLLMEDVRTELDNFGPAKHPDAYALINMIENIARIHAITMNRKNINESWMLDFKEWIKRGSEIVESLFDGDLTKESIKYFIEDEPDNDIKLKQMLTDIKKYKLELNENRSHRLNEIVDVFMDTSHALCHNELHFRNVGWDHENMYLIDWELVGVSPVSWDLYCFYAGIPKPEISENQAFNIYFTTLEEYGIYIDKEKFVKSYRACEIIEAITFKIRDLIIEAYFSDADSFIKELHRDHIKKFMRSVNQKMSTYVY